MVENPELHVVTNCELEWVKIQLKYRKELLTGSFYMPHQNMEDVKELEKSLNLVSNKKNIISTGNFNCPDINWDTMTVNQDAQDKEIQRAVMEVVTANSMVQIHEQPTRGNNLLDIVLTTNSSLIKSSNNAQGIYDHEIVVTDCHTKPYYQSKTGTNSMKT